MFKKVKERMSMLSIGMEDIKKDPSLTYRDEKYNAKYFKRALNVINISSDTEKENIQS